MIYFADVKIFSSFLPPFSYRGDYGTIIEISNWQGSYYFLLANVRVNFKVNTNMVKTVWLTAASSNEHEWWVVSVFPCMLTWECVGPVKFFFIFFVSAIFPLVISSLNLLGSLIEIVGFSRLFVFQHLIPSKDNHNISVEINETEVSSRRNEL